MTPLRVEIVVDGDVMPWSPADLEDRGLGGTETGVVRVAAELAARGHEVTVFAAVAGAGLAAGGVAWRPRDDWEPAASRDVLLAVRAPGAVAASAGDGAVRLLWLHDPDGVPGFTPQIAERTDAVLAVSGWHAERLRDRLTLPAERVVAVGNGVDPLPAPPGTVRERRVVTTIQPERGVDVLLELWPEIRAAVPGATLSCCHAPVYDHIAPRNPRVAAHRERIAELATQPGVELLAPLGRHALGALLARSRVWAHPSWSTPWEVPFLETSCIAAMEAQAAGLCVVASAWGALPETVVAGRLVEPLDAPGPRWRAALAEAIVEGLTDEAVQRRAAEDGPRAMAGRDWAAVTGRVLEVVERARAATGPVAP